MVGEGGGVRSGSGEVGGDGRLQERIFATSGLIFINKVVNVGEKNGHHGLGVERAENEGFGCDEKPSTLIHQTRAYVRPEIWFAIIGLAQPRLMQDSTSNQAAQF